MKICNTEIPVTSAGTRFICFSKIIFIIFCVCLSKCDSKTTVMSLTDTALIDTEPTDTAIDANINVDQMVSDEILDISINEAMADSENFSSFKAGFYRPIFYDFENDPIGKIIVKTEYGSGLGQVGVVNMWWNEEVNSGSEARPGAPDGPVSFATDSNGRFVILDQINDRILRFTSTGEFLDSHSIPFGRTSHITAGTSDKVYVLDMGYCNCIHILNLASKDSIQTIPIASDIPFSTKIYLEDETLYIVASNAHYPVMVGDSVLSPEKQISGAVPGRFSHALGVYLRASLKGEYNLLVEGVYKDGTVKFFQVLPSTLPLAAILSVQTDTTGNIYMTVLQEDSSVQPINLSQFAVAKFTADGKLFGEVVLPNYGGFFQTNPVFISHNGEIYQAQVHKDGYFISQANLSKPEQSQKQAPLKRSDTSPSRPMSSPSARQFDPMSLDEMFYRALSGQGYSYWWGHTKWLPLLPVTNSGCTYLQCWQNGQDVCNTYPYSSFHCASQCPISSPSLVSNGSVTQAAKDGCNCNTDLTEYGAECAGYVTKIWRVRGGQLDNTDNDTLATNLLDNDYTIIQRARIRPGDIFVTPAARGHVGFIRYCLPDNGNCATYESVGSRDGVTHDSHSSFYGYELRRRDNLERMEPPNLVWPEDNVMYNTTDSAEIFIKFKKPNNSMFPMKYEIKISLSQDFSNVPNVTQTVEYEPGQDNLLGINQAYKFYASEKNLTFEEGKRYYWKIRVKRPQALINAVNNTTFYDNNGNVLADTPVEYQEPPWSNVRSFSIGCETPLEKFDPPLPPDKEWKSACATINYIGPEEENAGGKIKAGDFLKVNFDVSVGGTCGNKVVVFCSDTLGGQLLNTNKVGSKDPPGLCLYSYCSYGTAQPVTDKNSGYGIYIEKTGNYDALFSTSPVSGKCVHKYDDKPCCPVTKNECFFNKNKTDCVTTTYYEGPACIVSGDSGTVGWSTVKLFEILP